MDIFARITSLTTHPNELIEAGQFKLVNNTMKCIFVKVFHASGEVFILSKKESGIFDHLA